jgi:hypothetical protein
MKIMSPRWLAVAMLSTACAASEAGDEAAAPTPPGGEDESACVPGHQTFCDCPGGVEGVQVCNDEGTGFGTCDCEETSSGSGGSAPMPCGDGMCSADENCHTCASDCGTCAPCDIAPSCEGADVPAAELPHVADLDVPAMQAVTAEMMRERLEAAVREGGLGMRLVAAALDQRAGALEHPLVAALREVFAAHPEASAALGRQLATAGMASPGAYRAAYPDPQFEEVVWKTRDGEFPGGTMECGAPLLRLAASHVQVHEEDDDFANDIVYCVIQAEASLGAEVRVTPQTPNLDEGDGHTFALESGVFWGQQGPTTPGGNILVTYDCFEADSSTGYQDLVDAIGHAAGQIGNSVEGDNGWIFDGAAAIAPIVSTGLALDNDDHLFNAQQTIELDRQLELTNGAFWTVRREGTHSLSDWDWELTIKAWGCAEYGEL